MHIFDWINQCIQPLVHYFKPQTSASMEADEEMVLLNHADSFNESEIEAVIERPQEQKIEEPDSISMLQVIQGLFSLILSRENRPQIAAATLLTVLGSGFNFLAPYLLGETLKLLTNEEETITINGIELSRTALISSLVTVFALSQLIPNLREQILVQVTTRNTQNVLERSTEHLLKKSLNYHVNTPSGDMIYLIQKGFSLSTIGTPLLTQIAPMLFEISVACTVLSHQYGWEIGTGLAGLLASYTAYSAGTAKPIVHARENSLKKGNEAWENFTSSISRYKTIHDFDKLKHALAEAKAALSTMTQADIQAMTIPLKISMGHILLPRLYMLLAALYVASGIPSGRYDVQAFAVLITYLSQLSSLLPDFGRAVNQFFASYPDLKFVLGELHKPDEIIDLYADTPLQLSIDQPPSIEFKDVCFSYPAKSGEETKPPLFQNLSFRIESGEKVALVSKSGAGKTTIFNLLYRYYTPTSGFITIDGQDISKVSLDSLQSNISLLGQTPNLFKGTVRANICYGAQNPDEVTEAMIWNLAQVAHLYDFLQDLKLDTDVGENGKALSGGQQQKVAILRGLLKQSSIRLLDEITAPFDSKSATEVLQSINKASDAMTSLMITHKLTEAQYVDKILVIDEGRVIAHGTHDELLTHCPLYQELWHAYTSQHNEDNTASSSTRKIMKSLGTKNPSSMQTTLISDQDIPSYQFDLFKRSSNKKPDEHTENELQLIT